jgi:HEAT repeat protein
MNTMFRSQKTAGLIAVAALFVASAGVAGGSVAPATYNPVIHAGRAVAYEQLPASSLEYVSTPDQILTVTQGASAPTQIWATLEHGEKVECLDCIGSVAQLLYDGNKKTREISAWWLRRRVFGVFGPGEVYSQVLGTLTTGSDEQRADAAAALGEFLIGDGVAPVAHAAVTDSAAIVRQSAVEALQRLNNEGPGAELGVAIADQSPDVRLSALEAAAHINVFSRVDAIVGALSDTTPDVRRRAADVLGTIRSSDAVVGLIALTDATREADPRVRTAAVSALGRIGDSSAYNAVNAATSDADPLVQSMATIALRRLVATP